MNGDGYADIAIDAYTEDGGGTDAGAVYLLYGSASGWTYSDLAYANVKLIGEAAGDDVRTGGSAGDLDADGYDELLIWSLTEDTGANNAGAAWVLYGGQSWSSTVDLADADFKVYGETATGFLGYNMSGLPGDINGDGYDDLVLPAENDNNTLATNGGTLFIFYGQGL